MQFGHHLVYWWLMTYAIRAPFGLLVVDDVCKSGHHLGSGATLHCVRCGSIEKKGVTKLGRSWDTRVSTCHVNGYILKVVVFVSDLHCFLPPRSSFRTERHAGYAHAHGTRVAHSREFGWVFGVRLGVGPPHGARRRPWSLPQGAYDYRPLVWAMGHEGCVKRRNAKGQKLERHRACFVNCPSRSRRWLVNCPSRSRRRPSCPRAARTGI